MATLDQYLGKGLIFPIELTSQGLPVIHSGPDLIRSSIRMILNWPYRQRIFLSSFGTRIHDLLEEPNDDLLKGVVAYFIFDSLRKWEKRIDILDSDIERYEPHKLNADVRYRIKSNGFEEVVTFPFYLNSANANG